MIPKGKQVTLISKHGTWFKISYSGKTSYVSSAYVKQTAISAPKPPASSKQPANQTANYITTVNLNLSSGASTKHKVLTVIPKGKQVTLISKHGTWFKVSYSGRNGYVSFIVRNVGIIRILEYINSKRSLMKTK